MFNHIHRISNDYRLKIILYKLLICMIQHIENQDNTLFQNSKIYNAVHNVLTYRGCEIKGAFHSITFTNGYSCCSLVTNSLMESFNGQRHGGAREELLG